MIFISHSSKDYDTVLPYVSFMETTGSKCWICERDMPDNTQDWADSIMKALRQSDIFFLFLTRNSVASEEVLNEIAAASSIHIPMIPFIAEKAPIPDTFLYRIRKFEWINATKLEASSIQAKLRERILSSQNQERETFLSTKLSDGFREFERNVLLHYYGKEYFIPINGQSFPVFCIKGNALQNVRSISDFDVLCDFEGSQLSDFSIEDHQNYKNLKWYQEYHHILEGRIRYPNRPGYMLDELETDENGYVKALRVHVGTYAENVYSNHILEYELYRAYQLFSGQDLDDPETWQKVRDFMELRNAMHTEAGSPQDPDFPEKMYLSLLKGSGRDSLLSVQMLVIIKSGRTHEYEAKLIQRSKNVASEPDVYQFLPAGGFEILNDSDDDIYDDIELWENFSPGSAIFREYLEELFNLPEFEGSGQGSIEDRLLKDPRIVEIEKMLQDKRAELQFLGSVMHLGGLRHELSFVLIIHDEAYSEKQFIANEECKKGIVKSIPVKQFETPRYRPIWKQLHGPSAAMWQLFKESPMYERLTEN